MHYCKRSIPRKGRQRNHAVLTRIAGVRTRATESLAMTSSHSTHTAGRRRAVAARAALSLVLCMPPLLAQADDTGRQILFDALGTIGKSVGLPAGTDAAAPTANRLPVPGAGASGCPRVNRGASLAAVGERPSDYAPAVLWPENGACEIMSFRDLKFPAAEAQKKAFTDASKVRCSDCEGGYGYDAWAKIPPAKFIALQPGERLSWKGSRYQGSVVLTGQHAIGNFPCRQYHWTLKDGSRVVAEREGLFCQYKAPYSTSPGWNEIL